jgi:hypothetical protein
MSESQGVRCDQQTRRRQFRLPEEDTEYLDALGLPWETIVEGNSRWVLLHDYPLPTGYGQTHATLAVQISACYPDGELDMVYFQPHLHRSDCRQIGALSDHRLDGNTWQRWSRHRTPENPWRVGVDNLAAHLMLVEYWLAREFEKQ